MEWPSQLLDILVAHVGETYEGEDAVEVLRRLSDFWREHCPS